MISASIRNVVRCFWWLAITVLAIVATAWAVLEHYLNAANGLELAGTETKPLKADSLIGPFIGAFLPKATLPQAMALTIALAEALAFFMIANQLHGILGLARHWRTSRQAGDDEQAREAAWQLLRTGVELTVLGCLLVWGILWDIEIFRYRSMAGASGLDDATEAAATLPSWALQLQEYGGAAAVQLARVGAWGYLSFTAVGCVMLECCIQRLDDAFARLMEPFDQQWDARMTGRTEEAEAEVFYGYDQDGQPVYDPTAPIAYDTEGRPVEEEQPATEPVHNPETPIQETQATNGTSNGAEVHAEEPQAPEMATVNTNRTAPHAAQNGNGAGHNGASGRPLFDPADAARPLSQPHAQPVTSVIREPEAADLREVFGGEPGERTSLAEAIAHPERYYVSLATGQVWRREAWQRLHTVHIETEEEGRS